MSLPVLLTPRLLLRGFEPQDASRVHALSQPMEVASTTLTMPHPYEPGVAEEWIAGHPAAWEARERLALAITTAQDGIVGAVGLNLELAHRHAELGYWIGVAFWNRGYATEAAAALLAFGFEELRLHRIVARHFPRNPASGRIMRKLGMVHEGTQREHVIRWGKFEDLECYAILEPEWRHLHAGSSDTAR